MRKAQFIGTTASVLCFFPLSTCGEPNPNEVTGLSKTEPLSKQAISLTGTSWRLVGYDSFESGAQRLTPASGEDYVIAFGAGGTLQLQLACNSGSGRWRADEHEPDRGGLAIDQVQSTVMTCPLARMENVARDLEQVSSYVLGPGKKLTLNLRADSGNLAWEKVR
jgi:hypothetical protein